MLVELFNFFSDSYGPLRVFDYLSFRAIFATLTALFVSLILDNGVVGSDVFGSSEN